MAKKYSVSLTASAQNDLAQIYDYIAADSLRNAVAFIYETEKRILSLETFPERQPRIPENVYLGTELRHLVYKKYRIVYRVSQGYVSILRIFHGSKLLGL